MAISAFILFVWTVACWFSAPFDTPFLDLFVFDVDPVPLFAATLIAAAGAFALWILRRGREAWRSAATWLRQNRLDAIILIAIIALHLLLQIPSIMLYRGANDSDSAVLGVGGYHIADGVARPMYRHGVSYIGSLIQHLTAPLHLLFGKSPIFLRLVNSVFYAGFILCTFILARKLFGRRTALLSSLLAALAPFEIMVHLRHTEFAEIAFWGMLSLVVLVFLLERDRPSWRQYFWYGAVLGILFYAHPQGINFIITGLIALFVRDKLFFIRPAFALMPIGLFLGSIVTFINSYYYDWIIFRVFFARDSNVTSALERLPATLGGFLRHMPELLGLRKDFSAADLMGPLVTWVVLIAALACIGLFLFRQRAKILASLSVRSVNPGPALILILILTVSLTYCLSRFSSPPAPMRYLFPLWLAIPILLTSHIEGWRTALGKAVGASLILLFVAVFITSQIIYDASIIEAEQKWARWENFLHHNDITAFYGNYWVAYQTSFITSEGVVGSASFPEWLERYRPYTRLVDRAPDPPAYVFSPDIHPYHNELAAGLAEKLEHLGIACKRSEIEGRIVLHGLSERATPSQLRDMRSLNGAAIRNTVVQKIADLPGESEPWLLTLSVVNSGKTTWFANGKHGFPELVVLSEEGEELRRQPLLRDAPPGATISWRVLLDRAEVEGDSVGLQIRLNDIIINENKETYRADLHPAETAPTVQAQDLDAAGLFSKAKGLEPPDFMLISGWGVTELVGDQRFHWSGSTSSRLGFLLRRPRPLRLMMFLGPYRSGDIDAIQNVRVLCNGNEIASAVPLERNRDVTIFLDRSHLKRGWNVLTFAYAFTEPEYSLERRRMTYRIRPKAMVLSHIRIRKDPTLSR